MKQNKTLGFCGDLVRAQDPERFLITLFCPSRIRAPLWALFAFHAEIAKTREVVTETTIGLMRLTWWREKISEIYAGNHVQQNEILLDLAQAIRAYNLPQHLFDDVLYAREFDLEDILPENFDGFLKYAEYTSVPITKLACLIAGEDADAGLLRDVAVAYAVSGLLSATAFYARQQRCYLPQDLLTQHHIQPEQIYTGKAQLQPVIKDIRMQCGNAKYSIPKNLNILRTMQAIIQLRFAHIAKAQDDVFAQKFLQGMRFKMLRVLWTR